MGAAGDVGQFAAEKLFDNGRLCTWQARVNSGVDVTRQNCITVTQLRG